MMAASSRLLGMAMKPAFSTKMDMAMPAERYTSVTPHMLSNRPRSLTREKMGWDLLCPGTSRVMVNRMNSSLRPGNSNLAMT